MSVDDEGPFPPFPPGSPEEKKRARLFGPGHMRARSVHPSFEDIAAEITKLSFGKSGDGDPEPGEEDPPEPEWDPGPEVDGEGGMSERRYLTEPEEPPW